MTSKSELRQLFRQRLEKRDGEGDTKATSSRLVERFVRLFQDESKFPSDGVWVGFQPIGYEPDIRGVFARLEKERSFQWAFPRVDGERLAFVVPNDRSRMVANKWGILEPLESAGRFVPLQEIRGLLIPGLAFDKNLNRLGRGGGFYDRALAELHAHNPSAIKIGVAFDVQISNEILPVEAFDVAMDWVVTESRDMKRAAAVERKTS